MEGRRANRNLLSRLLLASTLLLALLGCDGGLPRGEETPCTWFPLAVGNRWEYRGFLNAGNVVVEIVSREEPFYEMIVTGGTGSPYRQQVACIDGVLYHRVVDEHERDWQAVLPTDLTWGGECHLLFDHDPYHSGIAELAAGVTLGLPADTFENCAYLHYGSTSEEYYCPDVGLVYFHDEWWMLIGAWWQETWVLEDYTLADP